MYTKIKSDKERLFVLITQDQLEWVKKEAKRRDISIADLVRQILQKVIKDN